MFILRFILFINRISRNVSPLRHNRLRVNFCPCFRHRSMGQSRIKNFLRYFSSSILVRATQEGGRKNRYKGPSRRLSNLYRPRGFRKSFSFLPHRTDVGMLHRSNLIIFMQRVCRQRFAFFRFRPVDFEGPLLRCFFFAKTRGIRGISVGSSGISATEDATGGAYILGIKYVSLIYLPLYTSM